MVRACKPRENAASVPLPSGLCIARNFRGLFVGQQGLSWLLAAAERQGHRGRVGGRAGWGRPPTCENTGIGAIGLAIVGDVRPAMAELLGEVRHSACTRTYATATALSSLR